VWKAVKPYVNGGLSGMASTCVIQPLDSASIVRCDAMRCDAMDGMMMMMMMMMMMRSSAAGARTRVASWRAIRVMCARDVCVYVCVLCMCCVLTASCDCCGDV